MEIQSLLSFLANDFLCSINYESCLGFYRLFYPTKEEDKIGISRIFKKCLNSFYTVIYLFIWTTTINPIKIIL
ncbi:unnamed protein product [Blepharisma stoltei]|uniref:Uncharacterized protein n=1 Tax=Blepharisma stoltei TaxID=1481888 RepID=A0AAU9J4P4_9CILI|nr:unnamed protein product [Blepharisma stoltei]